MLSVFGEQPEAEYLNLVKHTTSTSETQPCAGLSLTSWLQCAPIKPAVPNHALFSDTYFNSKRDWQWAWNTGRRDTASPVRGDSILITKFIPIIMTAMQRWTKITYHNYCILLNKCPSVMQVSGQDFAKLRLCKVNVCELSQPSRHLFCYSQ